MSHAQVATSSTAAAAPGATAPGAPAPDATAPAAASSDGLGDIIVTAQRRSERVQNVPIAITTANREQLAEAGVVNVANLSTLSPSVSFHVYNFAASSANIQIRGIGTTGNARSFEGAVGVFVDGVYRTRSGQALGNFLDIDDVQILKGPQGTLFGKNTSAGAILINSAAPRTDKLGGTYEASYGNLDSYLVRGAVNVPLSDELAVRVAGVASGNEGDFKDPNGGRLNTTHNWAVKGQLLWKPTATLRFRLITDYAKTTGNCCYGIAVTKAGPTQPFIDALTAANGLILPSRNVSDREAISNPKTPNLIKDYGAVLNSQLDIGKGTLTSITALRRYSVFQTQDADFSGADILDLDESFKSHFFSQELTYSGQLDGGIKAHYVVGGYYSHEKLILGRAIRWGSQAQAYWDAVFGAAGLPPGFADAAPGLFAAENMGGTDRALAAFAHTDVDLTDKLGLILGARYTNEKKTGFFRDTYFRDALFDPLALAGVMPGIPFTAQEKDSSLSGTAGLKYQFNRNALVYANYNRGFKAGGVNLDADSAGIAGSKVFGSPAILQSPTYKPEIVNAGEIGAKIDWLDGHARTNIAGFYDKISNLQLSQFLGLQFSILNAPSAKVYGLELDQTYKFSQALTIVGGATWLPKANFGNSPVLLNLANRRFATSPRFASNIAFMSEVPLTDRLNIVSRLQVQYQSKVFTNPVTDDTQNGFVLVNANLGIASPAAGWRIEGFANNLLNKTYVGQHVNIPLQAGSIGGYLGAPRTYGITLRGTF